jgi:hypothetical protein
LSIQWRVNERYKMRIIIFLIIGLVFYACQNRPKESILEEPRGVVIDSIFNDYFMPRGEGFTGGDGTYSVVLPDGQVIWIFGDTFLGNVTEDWKRVKTDPQYIRNCFVTISKDGDLNTLHQGEPFEFKSMMIPPEVNNSNSTLSEHEVWYWPGDAMVENNQLKVFVSWFFQEEEDMWGFKFLGTELIEFSLPDLEIKNIVRFDKLDEIHFGHSVCRTTDYTYIYGLKEHVPYLARVTSGDVNKEWEFHGEFGWVKDARLAIPILTEFRGSEQFSVFQWHDQYIMIMQEGDLGKGIYSFTAKLPEGPWGNKQLLYETPIPLDNPNQWTYNALAHPQYMEDNMLLISYNTNSMEMHDHYEDALIYRPRFIRVPMEMIIIN